MSSKVDRRPKPTREIYRPPKSRTSPNENNVNSSNDFRNSSNEFRRNDVDQQQPQRNSTRKYSKQQHAPRLPKTYEENESSEIELSSTIVIKSKKAKEPETGEEDWRKYVKKEPKPVAPAVDNGAKNYPNRTSPKHLPHQKIEPKNDSSNRKLPFKPHETDFRMAPIQNHQVVAIKETRPSTLNSVEDFKNISWSEEVEEEEAFQAAALAAAAKTINNDVGSSSSAQHQRGGLLQLPAHLMNQTKDNYQKDVGKRNKPKGRGFRPNNNYVDPEYSRGPPTNLHRLSALPMPYAQDDAMGYERNVGRGRSYSSSFDYSDSLPRPGSQPNFGSRRQTPPSMIDSTTPTNLPEYTRAAKTVEDKYLPEIQRFSHDLKEQYDLASKNKPFELAKIDVYRRRLQELYREAVLLDLMYSYRNNLEHRMWKGAFYDTIEILRSYETYDLGRSFKAQTMDAANEMRGMLFRLLDEAHNFYENLKLSYEDKYGFVLTDHLRTIDENLMNVVKPTCDRLTQTLKYALLSCQRFEVALGDVERYREQLKKGDINYQSARKYYLNAVQLGPTNGRPYNQLALLAQYTKRRLDIVFYYFRSLSVKHAFETAKDSIKTVFEEQNKKVKLHEDQLNQHLSKLEKTRRDEELKKSGGDYTNRVRREIWINVDGSTSTELQKVSEINSRNADLDWFRQTTTHDLYRRFLTYFLHLHGMLFAKINMDQFEPMAEKCLIQFRELLTRQESPLTPMQLVQIVVICFYSVHHSATKELERDTFTLLQHNAVQLCLSIFGLLLERLEFLYKSNNSSFDFDARLHLLLPALRLFSTYLCNSDAYKCVSMVGYLGGIETPKFSVNIWTHLSNMCNAIEQSKADKRIVVAVQDPSVPGTTPVLFPEDYSCSPMFNIYSSKLVPVNLPAGYTEDYAIDCARLDTILQLGMYLDGVSSTVLSYDMDNKCYMAMNAVRSASPEPIHRRLEASDDESEPVDKNGLANDYDLQSASDEMKQLRMQKKDEESKLKLLEQEQCRIVLNICPKWLIPDTNSFIEHLSSIKRLYKSEKFTLAVPIVVVNELIGLKKHPDSEWVASQAVDAMKYLEECSNDGEKRFSVLTTDGSFLPTLQYLNESTSTRESNDDRILKCCLSLVRDEPRSDIRNLKDEPLMLNRKMVLLTDDRNLRVKALGRDVPVRSVPHFIKWAKV